MVLLMGMAKALQTAILWDSWWGCRMACYLVLARASQMDWH